ncbi:MAG: patatin-like phospholipase family protein [Candidatus Alcyoniella australis]|nr:patatin-like phospholipase family protein [Candidatus Alcyoniella australis]
MGISIVQKSDLTVRKRNPKISLVLAGGAVSGGFYKLGGIKALSDLMVNRDVTDFDTFVGLSAGSILASSLASGISPEEMIKSIEGKSERIGQLRPLDFYNVNLAEFVRKPLDLLYYSLSVLPRFMINFNASIFSPDYKLFSTVTRFMRRPTSKNFDSLAKLFIRLVATSQEMPSLLEFVPSGIFDNSRIEAYLRRNMMRSNMKNDFMEMHNRRRKELYITAMNLDTSERVVFGHDEDSSLTISEAVQASTALPGWFKPARIKGIDYVDGGIGATADIDVAVNHGANLIICYNPFRPVVNQLLIRYYKEFDTYVSDKKHLADRGLLAVLNQAFRVLLSERLHSSLNYYKNDPNFMGDIILVEPSIHDYHFFEMNPLNFWESAKSAEHGYISFKESLEKRYPEIKAIFNSYGLETTMIFLDEDTKKMKKAPFDESIIGILGKEKIKRDIRLAI